MPDPTPQQRAERIAEETGLPLQSFSTRRSGTTSTLFDIHLEGGFWLSRVACQTIERLLDERDAFQDGYERAMYTSRKYRNERDALRAERDRLRTELELIWGRCVDALGYTTAALADDTTTGGSTVPKGGK